MNNIELFRVSGDLLEDLYVIASSMNEAYSKASSYYLDRGCDPNKRLKKIEIITGENSTLVK